MSLRALLFRRPPDPQLIEIAFDGAIYPVELRRHRQARRYTLRMQAANRAVVLTMPMRGQRARGARLRGTQRRMDRGAAEAPAASDPVRGRTGIAAARRAASHRAPHDRARHGVDRGRRASRCCALRANPRILRGVCAIFSSARRSATSKRRAAATPRCSALRSSASRYATRRAAGAHARRPACSRIRGG